MTKTDLEKLDAAARRKHWEDMMWFHIFAVGLPAPEREYTFHETRKWAFDFAWPQHMLAVEVEGVTWEGGRHQRKSGFEQDCRKYIEAQCLGWTVLRVTQDMIKAGTAINYLERILTKRLQLESQPKNRKGERPFSPR